MIQQGFHIGDNDWYLMCYYDIKSKHDLSEVKIALLASECDEDCANEAVSVLSNVNTGYTFTNLKEHLTLILVSHTTSAEQMYDSIQHELKHAVEHISEYYDVCPRGEEAAYLQGEIARNMFAAAAFVVCPMCS